MPVGSCVGVCFVARDGYCVPLPRVGNDSAKGALGFLCCAKAKEAGTCPPSSPWPWPWHLSSSSSPPCAVDVVLCHRSRWQEASSVIGSFEGQNSVQFCPISVQDHFSAEGQKSVQFCPSFVQVLTRTTFLPEMDASQRKLKKPASCVATPAAAHLLIIIARPGRLATTEAHDRHGRESWLGPEQGRPPERLHYRLPRPRTTH